VDVSREPLSSLNICHHPDVGQILLQMPPLPNLQEPVKEKSGERVDRRDSQCFKLTLALADRGAYDESLRIIVDHME